MSVLADQTDGTEFLGGIQLGDAVPHQVSWLVIHEVAHIWFRGLVGNKPCVPPVAAAGQAPRSTTSYEPS